MLLLFTGFLGVLGVGDSVPPAIPPVPTQMAAGQENRWLSVVGPKVNLLLRGKMNAVTILTLDPGATSTQLIDERIGIFSAVNLTALTASAAAATGLWVQRTQGSATIHHDSTADVDRTFTVLIIG